jgi:hypothetical protein
MPETSDPEDDMSSTRTAVSLDKELVRAIRRVAGNEATSTWIADAARRKLGSPALLEVIDESQSHSKPKFVMCIDNSDYLVSLELHKVYRVLPDKQAAQDDCLRVIDESGEDYIYAAKRFVPVELPNRAVKFFPLEIQSRR